MVEIVDSMTSSRVCRQLFGPVDHEKVATVTRRLQDEQSEELKRRWNFDFTSMTPCSGRWDWVFMDTVSEKKSAPSPSSTDAEAGTSSREAVGLPISDVNSSNASSSSSSHVTSLSAAGQLRVKRRYITGEHSYCLFDLDLCAKNILTLL